MKRIITLLSMFLFAGGILMAQTTQPKLSYGVVIRDNANYLLVNKAATVNVSIYNVADVDDDEALYVKNDIEAETDANGLLVLSLGDESTAWNSIDWRTAKINLHIVCDGNTIDLEEPVYAVPYALQAPNSMKLTTEEIVRYIMSINFEDDLKNQILKAYHENPNNLENDWVDTFKHYLMTHMDSIKSIVLSYADKVTNADIWNTYNTVLANEEAMSTGMTVLKQYAKENMAAAKEIMMEWLSEDFTTENQADLQQVVDKMKTNNPEVYSYIKSYLEGMVKEYLKNHKYVTNEDCPSVNICPGH